MTEALARYHEYADTELSKGISELESFNRALEEKKMQLHVEATVGVRKGGDIAECGEHGAGAVGGAVAARGEHPAGERRGDAGGEVARADESLAACVAARGDDSADAAGSAEQRDVPAGDAIQAVAGERAQRRAVCGGGDGAGAEGEAAAGTVAGADRRVAATRLAKRRVQACAGGGEEGCGRHRWRVGGAGAAHRGDHGDGAG